MDLLLLLIVAVEAWWVPIVGLVPVSTMDVWSISSSRCWREASREFSSKTGEFHNDSDSGEEFFWIKEFPLHMLRSRKLVEGTFGVVWDGGGVVMLEGGDKFSNHAIEIPSKCL
jgi:hypothetical protein